MQTYLKKNLRGNLLNSYKESLQKLGLNSIQRDILVGTLLGDASMQAMKGDQESNIKFEQKISQIDYILVPNHLYENFVDWVGTPPQIRNITGGGAKDRQSVWFRTYRHPLFSFYKELFYKIDENGKQYKIVPSNIYELLTPRAIAYWFMDDGTVLRQYRTSNNITYYILNTQGFSYSDQLILVKVLKDKFNLSVNLWKDKDSYKIGVLSESRERFHDIIAPYILPSFQYKIK